MRKIPRGGTLIELLVAIVLLDLALLSLATVGVVTAKRVGDAGRRSRATLAAANRIERLSALSCPAIVAGAQQLELGVAETWSVTRNGSVLEMTDSIEITARPPERIVVRRRIVCL